MAGAWLRLRGVAIVTIATYAACATVPPCPARGGPVWRELTSEHFVLRSDLPLDEATEVLRTLEETRAGMLAAVWPGATGPSGHTQAITLSSERELSAFTGPFIGGVHLRHPPPFPSTLVMGATDASQTAAKHELAHNLAFHFLPVEPPWYAEGLASFLQTIRYDRAKGRSSVGQPDEEFYGYFRVGTPMDPEKLLGRVPADPFERNRFYATSWLLMHYICNKRPDNWRRLQHRLGALEPGASAFKAEFPDLDGDGLYRTLIDYASSGQYVVEQRTVAPWTETPNVRTMTDAEVHGVRAFLYWSTRTMNGETTDAIIQAELEEGLRAETPPLDALAVAFYGPDAASPERRAALVARAIRTHPDEWMAWVMSADLAPSTVRAVRAYLFRALSLAPDEPEILVRLAAVDAQEGFWEDALSLTNRVLGAGVVHHEAWLIHLAALRETGHCADAGHWAATLAAYLPAEEAQAIDDAANRPCQERSFGGAAPTSGSAAATATTARPPSAPFAAPGACAAPPCAA